MSSFQPGSDLVEARAGLARAVDAVLGKLALGVLPDAAERERVDCKEEAGRRGSGGVLLPGEPHNLAAVEKLADEVACFSNTPGGGAIIVGVDDRTGELLGAALDAEWLRHRIYQAVDVAPAVEERLVDGVRLLVLYVAAAREPVEDRANRIRWRVGSACVPVDRAEWWRHRQDQPGHDSMAEPTERTVEDIAPGAVAQLRRYLGSRHERNEPLADLVGTLGGLLPDGRLTQAAALVLCPADRDHLTVTAIDVEGGDIVARSPSFRGTSVLEQIASVEARLDPLNSEIVVSRASFAHHPIRALPVAVVREAILNGVIHRDWLQPRPVEITWVVADSALEVVSPGGFIGGVTERNVLTKRYARHPALADFFRAIGLVEKQGLGVDRMYREMVALGHRPPIIEEHGGPSVRARVRGGVPVVPVMALTNRIQPSIRRRDVRIALIVDALLRSPFVTDAQIAVALQRTVPEAREAIETAEDCRVDGQPLLSRLKDVWTLSAAAVELVESAGSSEAPGSRGVLWYRRPDDPAPVVRQWLAVHSQMTSGDHAALTGLSQAGALNQLRRLEKAGLVAAGAERGRNAHFVRGPLLPES